MEFEKIREIIADVLSLDENEITMDTSFRDDLGADSLDLFQIISELEDFYGVEFPTEEAENIKTVSDAVEFIQNNV